MNEQNPKPIVIRVVAVNLDKRLLTLYKEDGETYTIPQGDPRIQGILDLAVPICAKGGVAVVAIGQEEPPQPNHYSEVEEKTGGLIKFFRVAKNKLKEFFSSQEQEEPVYIEPVSAGVVPGTEPVQKPAVQDVAVSVDDVKALDEAVPEKTSKAISEIMQHAIPSTSKEFDHADNREKLQPEGEDTIVAMVGNKLVPDVQNLKSQIKASGQESATTVGLQRFLERCAAVATKRKHSVEDLMKFMQRGDLPIADDGSIVIYKVLAKGNAGHTGFDYVDCHTRKVPQRVGSYVFMAENLVDHNRNNECSNGLHVARRGYIRSFSGDVCVLAKVNPEDVIAVPQYDANKMRVAGYHILAELSQEAYDLLRMGKPMTSLEECKVLLGNVLAGEHIGVTNTVEITQQQGGGIKTVELAPTDAPEAPVEAPEAEAEVPAAPVEETPVRVAEALPDEPEKEDEEPELSAPVIDPKALAKSVAKPASQLQTLKRNWLDAKTPAERQAAAVALLGYKKSSKKSWDKLGLNLSDVASIQRLAGEPSEAKPAVKAGKPKAKGKVAKAKPKAVAPSNAAVPEVGTLDKDQLLALVAQGSVPAAQELFARKRAKKKSWQALGYNSTQIDRIEKLLK